ERIPVDRVYRQKVQAEWKRDAYREVNTKLLQLRTKIFDLRLQSSFSTRKVTSTNPALVTATAAGSAVDGTYEIRVQQLAESALAELDYNELMSAFAASDPEEGEGSVLEEIELTFK